MDWPCDRMHADRPSKRTVAEKHQRHIHGKGLLKKRRTKKERDVVNNIEPNPHTFAARYKE